MNPRPSHVTGGEKEGLDEEQWQINAFSFHATWENQGGVRVGIPWLGAFDRCIQCVKCYWLGGLIGTTDAVNPVSIIRSALDAEVT